MDNTQENTFTSEGAKSVISEDMQNLTRGEEDISHTVQGHRANLSNPSKFPCSCPCSFLTFSNHCPDIRLDTSQRSKEHSKQVIDELGGQTAHYGKMGEEKTKNAAENLQNDPTK